MKIATIFLAVGMAVFWTASVSYAQASLKLVPRKYSEVELVLGSRSVIFDLEEALTGTNGILAGNPPHRYTGWFTAAKDGFYYLVANVRSSSPITNPMAPC